MVKKEAKNSHPLIDKLDMIGIVKRFPGVLANDHINLELKSGEILALLGENAGCEKVLL